MRICIIGLLLLAATPLHAHSWYPEECCSGTDCSEMAQSRVKVTPEGYLLDNRQTIPFKDAQNSPDEHYHGCFPATMQGKANCFWAPKGGY